MRINKEMNSVKNILTFAESSLFFMRPVKAIHQAVFEPVSDLVTYRAMPTPEVPMNLLDPFIFLNHHGRQEYPPNSRASLLVLILIADLKQ